MADPEPLYDVTSGGPYDAGEELLYHYTRAETALKDVLPNRALRLNSYRFMRDPLENKELPFMVRYSGAAKPDRLPLREAQQLLNDLRDRAKLLSLTSDATGYDDDRVRVFGKGYARPRMWEQYAENHQGVCLAFSAECLTNDFYEKVKRIGAGTCGPVRYTAGGFALSEARLLPGDELTEATAADVLTGHLMQHHEDFWFLKLLDWETEFEYRVVLFAPGVDPDEPVDVSFGGCLRAVILGEKFADAGLADAEELAKALGVDLLRLTWAGGRPVTESV